MVDGRRIKSLVFTTNPVITRNCDADVVSAVYPFTPQSATSRAPINGSYVLVFCGCGGDATKGLCTFSLAQDAEGQGAIGTVPSVPVSDLNLLAVTKVVDIPVIIAVISEEIDIVARPANSVSILSVTVNLGTVALVRKIRRDFPEVPIIVGGGNIEENIQVTITTGVNAVIFIPPPTAELFKSTMVGYRES